MSSDKDQKKRMARFDVELPDAQMSKPIGTNILGRLGHKAAVAKEIQVNKLKAEQVKGQELATQFLEATNKLKRAHDEGKDDRLGKEFKNERKELDAKLQETTNRVATAKAQADEVISESNARKRRNEAEEKRASVDIENADNEILKAQVERQKLMKQLEAGVSEQLEFDKRTELVAELEQIDAELHSVEEGISALLEIDGETADTKRRALEVKRTELIQRKAQIEAEIAELDNDQ